MVTDQLKNASIYYGISERVKSAFEFIKNNDATKMEPGRYNIDGDNVFALVQTYDSKTMDKGRWEAHKNYLDVQYVASGTEKMGYAHISGMKVKDEYVPEKDIMFLTGEGTFFPAASGTFAIFYPEDVHMPGMAVGSPEKIIKVVVKVRV